MSEAKSLNKLISLTFDEDPSVRKKAAEMLAKSDDPGAIFALVELSYDKEPEVRELAQKLLESKKSSQPEMMSFADVFGRFDDSSKEEVPKDTKDKILKPIERLFEIKLGKEKAEIVKKKMMPTIEKIYLKAKRSRGKRSKDKYEEGRKEVQEFLTSYLELVSGLEDEHLENEEVGKNLEEVNVDKHFKGEEGRGDVGIDASAEIETEIGEVGKEIKPEGLSAELMEISDEDLIVEDERDRVFEQLSKMPNSLFKKAYEIMMLSDGDEDIMKREMKRMIKEAEHDIKLAFKLAKRRFKEMNITNLTAIKDKMRNINTDVLEVVDVENKEYQKSKKVRDVFTRVVVRDEHGNEGVVYLFEGRGGALRPGFKIKLERAIAKSFKFSGETALTLGKRSNLYIVL